MTNAIKSVNFGETEVMVRINPLTTCGVEDLAAVLPAGPDAIVVPKSENREGVQVVEKAILESKLSKTGGDPAADRIGKGHSERL